MQFLIDNALLILLAITSGGMLLWTSLNSGGAIGGTGKVSAAEAVRLVNREKAVLIDVGEPAEYDAGHAVGARNVPFGSLAEAKPGGKGLPINKSLPVVLICPTGARAGRAAGVLRKQGYERPVVLAGGMKSWREATLPVEKKA